MPGGPKSKTKKPKDQITKASFSGTTHTAHVRRNPFNGRSSLPFCSRECDGIAPLALKGGHPALDKPRRLRRLYLLLLGGWSPTRKLPTRKLPCSHPLAEASEIRDAKSQNLAQIVERLPKKSSSCPKSRGFQAKPPEGMFARRIGLFRASLARILSFSVDAPPHFLQACRCHCAQLAQRPSRSRGQGLLNLGNNAEGDGFRRFRAQVQAHGGVQLGQPALGLRIR